ncbi:MAG: ATP-binding cassette domain-containing protein [gamma proteobacterium endosymbiont of Lamellibrachia anaximandri]|nr:ATP-binding cassette domain-containing protein [gamma proteobacterium endosymbiont of Lamellibrachia anaximandri]MBL3535515.1 ATP-binding cassette domain-containing protein [gamma proteobacterium endosymbiont of Lamellibrachia anaximandri]
MLRFEKLSLRRGIKLLFENASFTLHAGWKTGITGGNGTGKSSLFSLILDQLQADEGELHLPPKLEIAHVAQETPSLARPAIEYVIDGDSELRKCEQALAEAESAGDGSAQARLHELLQTIGGYTARSRAGQLMHGLGFTAAEEERPVNSFSGGWRMRLNLAQALMCRSDLLLLDEPTNHLDLDAVIWLEEWLRSYPGTLLLISHDRDFLDRVADHIVHIEQQQAALYTGNYATFEQTRAARLANQQVEYEKQQREVAHIRSYVDRFRAKATKARQAQSRLKALERMELIASAHVDSQFHFSFLEPEKNPHPLLQLEQVDGGYDESPVFSKATVLIEPGDRVGLLGPNGAGKSTLIKLLAGSLEPLAGSRHPAQDLRIGYFAQHQIEQLDPEASPLLHLERLDPLASEQRLRDFVGGFGFRGDRAMEKVAPFSGGEKARLVLALLVYQRPNLLLLDEPTNHLDLEMRHALGSALQEFVGAMVIVSHDRHLLRITTDQLWLVHGGRVEEFAGDLDDYPAWLLEQRRQTNGGEKPLADGEHTAKTRRDRKRQEAEQRRQLKPLRNRLKKLETEMERCQQQQQDLEEILADTGLYQDDRKEEMRRRLAEKAALDALLSDTEEAWLEAGEALETAQSEIE